MNSELQRHKTGDTVNRILTLLAFILVGVLLIGIICNRFDRNGEEIQENSELSAVIDGDGNDMSGGEVYAMPKAMSFTSTALLAATSSGSTSVDVQIEAYITPSSAANKLVDYSVAWGSGASRASESVSNYLTVTQDSDGSTTATVSCKKAFGSDKIIITVTTRDGGYTATCTVSFVGVASSMSVSCSSAALSSSTSRGSYYSLSTSKTYTFDIDLSNVYNSVGSSNLSVTLGGSGSLYFGTCYFNDGGFPVWTSGSYELKNMSDIVSAFITSATVSGTTLTVKTGSRYLENYYSSYGSDDYGLVTYYYGKYVCEFDDYLNMKDSSSTFNNSYAKTNAAAISSCYFTVTVKDSVSGLSETVKLWLDGVSGVSLSSTLSF